MERRLNRLAHARSPYLRQHADNPVDWYPWDREALEKARQEDKPIFLSVGYSACHWCHVMERESFRDPTIAELLNRYFVPVKVDREERPDLDMIYQRAAQLAGVPGGWPLSVFLTPDLKPFWVGTYLPPDDRWGRPGFRRLLLALAEAWRTRRQEVEETAERFAQALARLDAPPEPVSGLEVAAPPEPGSGLLAAAAAALLRHVDWRHGGLGVRPKFPNAPALELLLRAALRLPEDEVGKASRRALLLTLRRMARGGIYDQLGGGFHRYAVDEAWVVPHFEKMLYDNAQLLPLYAWGSLLADDPRDARLFQRVIRETAAYLAREMVHPEGGLYASQDADSEEEEGRFYVWTRDELEQVLGEEDARLAAEHLGVTETGNFEHGRSVLRLAATAEELAARRGGDPEAMERRLEEIRRRLWEARQRRPRPATDDKVLAAWNGLAIAGLARTYLIHPLPELLSLARGAADFALARLVAPDGSVFRAYQGGEAYLPGFLEDYAFLALGLLELHQAALVPQYAEVALRLAERALERFADPEVGFLFVPPQGDPLPTRPRDVTDAAMPSATAAMTQALVWLEPFRGDGRFAAAAEKVFRLYRRFMEEHPWEAASLILAWDAWASGYLEVALAGPEEPLRQWAHRIARLPLPARLLTRVPEPLPADPPPVWAGRQAVDGRPTAYVCFRGTCSLPLTRWEEVEQALLAASPRG